MALNGTQESGHRHRQRQRLEVRAIRHKSKSLSFTFALTSRIIRNSSNSNISSSLSERPTRARSSRCCCECAARGNFGFARRHTSLVAHMRVRKRIYSIRCSLLIINNLLTQSQRKRKIILLADECLTFGVSICRLNLCSLYSYLISIYPVITASEILDATLALSVSTSLAIPRSLVLISMRSSQNCLR